MDVQLMQGEAVNTSLRLDPRTKLLLTLAVSFVMILGSMHGLMLYVRLVLAVLPFVLLLVSNRTKAALLYGAAYAGSWCAELFLIDNTSGFFYFLLVIVTMLVSRFIPCLVTGYYLTATTRVSEFIAAMERMRFSRNVIIPLAVMLRFFPTISEESSSINDAMRMRGMGVRSLAKNPIGVLEYRLIPLLMSAVKIGDELSAAALTKGLGGPEKRTNICKIGFGFWDVVLNTVSLAALIFFILNQGGII